MEDEKKAPPYKADDEKKTDAAPKDVTAEDAMAAEEQEADAVVATAGASAPTPTEAIPVNDYEQLIGALNEAMAFLTDGQVPAVEWKAPDKLGGTMAPLPGEAFVQLVAIAQAAQALSPKSEEIAGIVFDPGTDPTTREGIRTITTKLGRAATSQALKDGIVEVLASKGEGGAGEPAPEAAPPAVPA